MDKLKVILTSAPVLQNANFSKKFYLHCDASNFGVGAVLIQMSEENDEKPIAFMSKKLSSAQRNYSVTERECLAVILAIEKFRCYLELQEFELIFLGEAIRLGYPVAGQDFSKFAQFKAIKSYVKTADGNPHDVIGVLNVQMAYKDFWRIFQLAPNIINALEPDSETYPIPRRFMHRIRRVFYSLEQEKRLALPPSCCRHSDDVIKKILSNTAEIKQSLKGLTSRIEKLEEDNKKMHCRQLTELSMTQKLIKPKKESPILKSPCNSVEEFEKLEDNLMKSPELNEKLEDEILKHEGTDPSKFVRSMWRKILSDNVASQYSWKGTAKKKAIDIMAVTNAFRGAYNRKFLGSDKEFGRVTVKWFQTAKERHSKKKK
ncbi:hypothetical protein ACLKA7_007379 [Drosophila subpalustris]